MISITATGCSTRFRAPIEASTTVSVETRTRIVMKRKQNMLAYIDTTILTPRYYWCLCCLAWRNGSDRRQSPRQPANLQNVWWRLGLATSDGLLPFGSGANLRYVAENGGFTVQEFSILADIHMYYKTLDGERWMLRSWREREREKEKAPSVEAVAPFPASLLNEGHTSSLFLFTAIVTVASAFADVDEEMIVNTAVYLWLYLWFYLWLHLWLCLWLYLWLKKFFFFSFYLIVVNYSKLLSRYLNQSYEIKHAYHLLHGLIVPMD